MDKILPNFGRIFLFYFLISHIYTFYSEYNLSTIITMGSVGYEINLTYFVILQFFYEKILIFRNANPEKILQTKKKSYLFHFHTSVIPFPC